MGELQAGKEYWLPDGRRAFYVGDLDGQHMVRLVLRAEEDWGECFYPSDYVIPAPRLLDSEPKPVFASTILAAEERLQALREKEAALRADIAVLQKNERDVREAAKKWPDARQLVEFAEGRITHCVLHSVVSTPTIELLDDALRQMSGYGRFEGLRLVCLFGTKENGAPAIRYGLNQYTDGSGVTRTMTPCASLDEAHQVVRDLFVSEVERWRERKPEYQRSRLHLVERFRKSGVDLDWPPDYEAFRAELHQEQRQEQLAKLKQQVAELEASPEPGQ